MQNQSTSVFLVRPTLETTPQISEALEKVSENTILITNTNTKNGYVTKTMHTGSGASAVITPLLEDTLKD